MSSRPSVSKEDAYSSADFPSHLLPWLEAVQEIVNAPLAGDVPEPPVVVLPPWLYLAPMKCVLPAKDLSEAGFTHVLSTNAMLPHILQSVYYELLGQGIEHCYVAALDILTYDMMGRHWEECLAFLQQAYEEQQKQGQDGGGQDQSNKPTVKVLVHCEAGMNRSGTIVAAAMLYFDRDSDLLQVFRTLKRQRGRVMTNTSFQKQLVQFAERLGRLGREPNSATIVEGG